MHFNVVYLISKQEKPKNCLFSGSGDCLQQLSQYDEIVFDISSVKNEYNFERLTKTFLFIFYFAETECIVDQPNGLDLQYSENLLNLSKSTLSELQPAEISNAI